MSGVLPKTGRFVPGAVSFHSVMLPPPHHHRWTRTSCRPRLVVCRPTDNSRSAVGSGSATMERPPSIPPSPKSVSSKSGRSTLPQVQVHMHKLDPEIVDNEPIVLEREG